MNQNKIIIYTLIVILILITILFYLYFQNKKESFEGIAGTSFVSRVPKGSIMAYYPSDGKITTIPAGWAACDGVATLSGNIKVPDLRGRFIRMYSNNLEGDATGWSPNFITKPLKDDLSNKELNGASRTDQRSIIQKLNLGEFGGTDVHMLTVEEMPSHKHDLRIGYNGVDGSGSTSAYGPSWVREAWDSWGGGFEMNTAGSNYGHNNMPPYYVLVYIIKL